MTEAADHVIRVEGQPDWLHHLESQARLNAGKARAMNVSSAVLERRHDCPVRSWLVLLRDTIGELKKLDFKVSRCTVVNVLKENGFDIGPKRGEGSWTDFVQQHASTLWACDFFSKPVWTLKGCVEVFVLFFIYVGARKIHFAGITPNPNEG